MTNRQAMRRRVPVVIRAVSTVVTATVMVAVAMTSLATSAGAASATGTPIKIGYVFPATGGLSSGYVNSQDGLVAFIDAYNKAGGYKGHPLQLVVQDDQSGAGIQTAVGALLSDGVSAIVSGSPFFSAAAKSVEQAGIPVIGAVTDGPEWGEQPYTNMFDLRGGINPNATGVADITAAPFFKSIGVKKLGALALGISASAVSTAKLTAQAATSIGLNMAFEDFSVPYGTWVAAPTVLQMKDAGVQGAYCVCDANTYSELITANRSEDARMKPLSFGGVDYTLFNNPTTDSAVQGAYYNSFFPPENSSAEAATVEKQMAAVVPGYKVGEVPNYAISEAYFAGQLIETGLQGTKVSDPTPQDIVASLQKVKDWTADGLLPAPISFTHFGTSESKYCAYFVKGVGKTFTFVNGGKPLCVTTPQSLR